MAAGDQPVDLPTEGQAHYMVVQQVKRPIPTWSPSQTCRIGVVPSKPAVLPQLFKESVLLHPSWSSPVPATPHSTAGMLWPGTLQASPSTSRQEWRGLTKDSFGTTEFGPCTRVLISWQDHLSSSWLLLASFFPGHLSVGGYLHPSFHSWVRPPAQIPA